MATPDHTAELLLINQLQSDLRGFITEMKGLGYNQNQIIAGVGSALFQNLELPAYVDFDDALVKDLAFTQCMVVLRMLQDRARAEGFNDFVVNEAFMVEEGAKHARWQIMIESQNKLKEKEIASN